jgi:hypothetical protein
MSLNNSNFSSDNYNSMIASFDSVTSGQPAGTKINLCLRLLMSVVHNMEMYDNPMESDFRKLATDLKELNAKRKADAQIRYNAKQ